MNAVDRTKAGVASGVLSMSRMVGGTVRRRGDRRAADRDRHVEDQRRPPPRPGRRRDRRSPTRSARGGAPRGHARRTSSPSPVTRSSRRSGIGLTIGAAVDARSAPSLALALIRGADPRRPAAVQPAEAEAQAAPRPSCRASEPTPPRAALAAERPGSGYDPGSDPRLRPGRCRARGRRFEPSRERRDRAGRAAGDDGGLGDPRGARGRAGRRLPARGDRGPRAGRVRGHRARDGRRRELQQRLGGARRAGLGVPLPPQRGPPHRRLRRIRDRLEGRRGRHPLEAGRRGRRPLQPGLLRGSGGPRPRSARRAEPADLGLRDELGLVRAVLQGPGPAAAAQAGAPGLGGGRLLRPDLLHRLPDADRPRASCRPATAS